MKINRLAILFATALFWAGGVLAGTCEIKYTRTACPGKEEISYKKCKGKQSCTKFKEAADVAECRSLAIAACANDRLTVTKSKVINALFDGAEIQTDAGNNDFCSAYDRTAEEFNRCDG